MTSNTSGPSSLLPVEVQLAVSFVDFTLSPANLAEITSASSLLRFFVLGVIVLKIALPARFC